MVLHHTTRQRRFAEGGRELLRVTLTVPQILDDREGILFQSFHSFYEELMVRSETFAEVSLYPAFQKEYESLSLHDRKFFALKRTYAVSAQAELCEGEGEAAPIMVTTAVSLKEKDRILFEASEVQHWEKRGEKYEIVPKKRREIQKETKRCE